MIVWTELFFRFAIWDAWPIFPVIWDIIVMMLFYSHCVQWTLCEDVGEGVGDSSERMFNLRKNYRYLASNPLFGQTKWYFGSHTHACIYKKIFNALFICLTLYNLPTVTQIFSKLLKSEVCVFIETNYMD